MIILGSLIATCVTGFSFASIIYNAAFVGVMDDVNNMSFDCGGLDEQ